MNIKEYFASLFTGFNSLLKGMAVTGRELVTPKVTEQYPENRGELQIPERFRATLKFIYDDQGRHKCIACRTCERNCPNGTITITTRAVDLPNGKKKNKLDKYVYDLGSCTFCGLCAQSCPTDAIEFDNDFEQAVFRREALVKQLNYLPEVDDEPAPAPKPAAAKPTPEAKPEVKPAEKEAPAAEAKPEAKAEVKAEAKPAEKAAEAPAAEVKPEAKPEVKAEEKPAEKAAEAPAAEAKPEVKAEEKPAEETTPADDKNDKQ